MLNGATMHPTLFDPVKNQQGEYGGFFSGSSNREIVNQCIFYLLIYIHIDTHVHIGTNCKTVQSDQRTNRPIQKSK